MHNQGNQYNKYKPEVPYVMKPELENTEIEDPKSELTPVKAEPNYVRVINCKSVNVRSDPSMGKNVIFEAVVGTVLELLYEHDSWYKVRSVPASNLTGYVLKDFATRV
jgi:SH3-like domain-containing protein